MFVTVEAVPDGPAQRRIVVRAVPTVLPERAPVTGVEADVVAPGGRLEKHALEPVDERRFEGRCPRVRGTLVDHVAAAPPGTSGHGGRVHHLGAVGQRRPAVVDPRTVTGLAALLILLALAVGVLLLGTSQDTTQ